MEGTRSVVFVAVVSLVSLGGDLAANLRIMCARRGCRVARCPSSGAPLGERRQVVVEWVCCTLSGADGN